MDPHRRNVLARNSRFKRGLGLSLSSGKTRAVCFVSQLQFTNLSEAMMDHAADHSPADFDALPDWEVEWMGMPFPQSKFLDGIWYCKRPDGRYVRFPFQERVREVATNDKV